MTTMENCNMDLPPHSPLLFKGALWALVKNECRFLSMWSLTLLLIYNEITIQQRDCPVSYHNVTAVPGSVLLMFCIPSMTKSSILNLVLLLSCFHVDLLSHLRNTAAFRIIQLELFHFHRSWSEMNILSLYVTLQSSSLKLVKCKCSGHSDFSGLVNILTLLSETPVEQDMHMTKNRKKMNW